MEERERPSQASRKTQSVSPARPEATSSEPREGEGEGRQRHRQSLRKLLDEQQKLSEEVRELARSGKSAVTVGRRPSRNEASVSPVGQGAAQGNRQNSLCRGESPPAGRGGKKSASSFLQTLLGPEPKRASKAQLACDTEDAGAHAQMADTALEQKSVLQDEGIRGSECRESKGEPRTVLGAVSEKESDWRVREAEEESTPAPRSAPRMEEMQQGHHMSQAKREAAGDASHVIAFAGDQGAVFAGHEMEDWRRTRGDTHEDDEEKSGENSREEDGSLEQGLSPVGTHEAALRGSYEDAQLPLLRQRPSLDADAQLVPGSSDQELPLGIAAESGRGNGGERDNEDAKGPREDRRSTQGIALNLESLRDSWGAQRGGRGDLAEHAAAEGGARQVGSARNVKASAMLSPHSGFSSYRSSSLHRERQRLPSPRGLADGDLSQRGSRGLDEQPGRELDEHDGGSSWKRDSNASSMRRRVRKVETLLQSLTKMVEQGLADILYCSKEQCTASHQVPLQDLFAALSKHVGGGRSAAGLVKEAQQLCEAQQQGHARSRRALKERIQRAQHDTGTILDDVLAEFNLLTRELSESASVGGARHDYVHMRAARDGALQDLAALSERSRNASKEAEAERAQLRGDLAHARIECEQLRGKVGDLEDEMQYHKMQVEQDRLVRGTVDAEKLKSQLLTLRADLLSNRADLLAQRELVSNAELEKEALRMSEARLGAALDESTSLLEQLQSEAGRRDELVEQKQAQLETLRREVKERERDAEKAKGQLEEVRAQLSAAQERHAHTNGLLDASIEELKVLQRDRQREREEWDDAQRERARAEKNVHDQEREGERERAKAKKREMQQGKDEERKREMHGRDKRGGRSSLGSGSRSPAREGRGVRETSFESDWELDTRKDRSRSRSRSRSIGRGRAGSLQGRHRDGIRRADTRHEGGGERGGGRDGSSDGDWRGKESRGGRSASRGRDGLSAQDEGRLMALQDHLSDVSHRLARAEKQREEQRKEAGRAQGQMQVMRSRISELQARIDAEEEALARAVRARDQKDGLARELRDRLSTQAQALDKAHLQRDDLIKEAQELRAQVEDLQGEMQGREDSFRERLETMQRRSHSEKSKLERQLQAQEREHAARGGGTSSRGRSSTDVAVSRSPWRAEREPGSRRSRSESGSGSPEGRAHVVAGNGSMADRVVHELTDKLEDLALKYASLKELHRNADEALQRSRAECSRLVSESVTNRLASMHTSPAHAPQAHQPRVTAPAHESAPHHLARGHPSGGTVCDERTDAAVGSMHDSGDGERRAQAQALQDELADLKQVCARLQSELSAKSGRLEGLEEALAGAGPAADAAYVRGLEDQLLSLKADMDTRQGEADKAAAEAREEVGRERERCNELKVEVALREEEMARRQSAWGAKTEQLAADLKACSTELEQCRAELVAERPMHSPDELKGALEALRLKVQEGEADLASARHKAAEDAGATRAACMEDMGKARLEAANRLSAQAEKYRGLLQDKEAELVAAKLELHGARAALADTHMSNQQLTDDLHTLRRAHRPCSVLIDDLRSKVTSLQADLNRSWHEQQRPVPRSPREFQIASSLLATPPRRDTTPPPPLAAHPTPMSPRTPAALLSLSGAEPARSTTPPARGAGAAGAAVVPLKEEPKFTPAHGRGPLTPRLHSVGIA